MGSEQTASFLGSVGLFEGLTREELLGLDHLGQEETHAAGDVVISQGDEDRDVYVVLDGSAEVEIELQLDEQKTKHLASFTEGEFFGEVAMVDRQPRSATVRAGKSGLTVMRIPYAKLDNIMERNSHIGYVILSHISQALCERIRATNVQVRDTFTWGRF